MCNVGANLSFRPSVTGSCRECKGLWKKETGTDSDGSTTFISTLSSQDGNLMENAFAIARRLLQRVVGLNTASMTDSFISASALTGPCSEDLPEGRTKKELSSRLSYRLRPRRGYGHPASK